MLDLTEKYSLRKGVSLRGVNSKYWLLDSVNGTQYQLNVTSYHILLELEKTKCLGEVIQNVFNMFDVQESILLHDVKTLLNKALAQNLIERGQKA